MYFRIYIYANFLNWTDPPGGLTESGETSAAGQHPAANPPSYPAPYCCWSEILIQLHKLPDFFLLISCRPALAAPPALAVHT